MPRRCSSVEIATCENLRAEGSNFARKYSATDNHQCCIWIPVCKRHESGGNQDKRGNPCVLSVLIKHTWSTSSRKVYAPQPVNDQVKNERKYLAVCCSRTGSAELKMCFLFVEFDRKTQEKTCRQSDEQNESVQCKRSNEFIRQIVEKTSGVMREEKSGSKAFHGYIYWTLRLWVV